ncbi:MAG TPA: hypothetical protein PLP05_10430 [Sedimentisphaerales bacterium]|nr:hypothetical protein [Sedimentisphaerales bacterium]
MPAEVFVDIHQRSIKTIKHLVKEHSEKFELMVIDNQGKLKEAKFVEDSVEFISNISYNINEVRRYINEQREKQSKRQGQRGNSENRGNDGRGSEKGDSQESSQTGENTRGKSQAGQSLKSPEKLFQDSWNIDDGAEYPIGKAKCCQRKTRQRGLGLS